MKDSFLVLMLCVMAASAARAADVVESFYNEMTTLYADPEGSKVLAKIKRSAVQKPTVVLSRESPYGLIMVRVKLQGGGRKPVIGWLQSGAVRVNNVPHIDVTECAPPSKGTATVTRAVRGLGQVCKQ